MSALCVEANELSEVIAKHHGELPAEVVQDWTRRLKLLDQERRMTVAADILVLALRFTRAGKGPWEALTDLALAAKSHAFAGGQRLEPSRDPAVYDRLSGRVARPAQQPPARGTRLLDLLASR